MGRVALMSVVCAETALQNAGLLGHEILSSGEAGVAFGSSAGSVDAVGEFASMLLHQSMSKINATTYIRMMAHQCGEHDRIFWPKRINFTYLKRVYLWFHGNGQAYEAIKYGKQQVMIAGGAEELSAAGAAVLMYCSRPVE